MRRALFFIVVIWVVCVSACAPTRKVLPPPPALPDKQEQVMKWGHYAVGLFVVTVILTVKVVDEIEKK